METKEAARKRMGALRRKVGPEAVEALAGELMRRLAGERHLLTIGAYLPIGSEPDLNPALVAWSRASRLRPTPPGSPRRRAQRWCPTPSSSPAWAGPVRAGASDMAAGTSTATSRA